MSGSDGLEVLPADAELTWLAERAALGARFGPREAKVLMRAATEIEALRSQVSIRSAYMRDAAAPPPPPRAVVMCQVYIEGTLPPSLNEPHAVLGPLPIEAARERAEQWNKAPLFPGARYWIEEFRGAEPCR